MKGRRALSATLVSVLGCVQGSDTRSSGEPADSAPRAAAPDSAASPGPVGEWLVSPTRAGPIELGASLAASLPALAAPIDTAAIADGCAYVTPVGGPDGLKLMVEGRRVVRAEVTSGATPTAEGARIGDTEARVLELYPDARRDPHKYTDGSYLVVIPGAPGDTLHRYVFETDGARVTVYRAGLYPPVAYVEGCS